MSDTMDICGLKAERGQKLQTYIPVLDSNTKIPITIINGQNDGPTLLITAGIHGGEYPGIAAAIEISQAIEPEVISGCLIIIHPVNIRSFWERSAFVTPDDGKNLSNNDGNVIARSAEAKPWIKMGTSTGNSPAMSTEHFHKKQPGCSVDIFSL